MSSASAAVPGEFPVTDVVVSVPATAQSASWLPTDVPFGWGTAQTGVAAAAAPQVVAKTVNYDADWFLGLRSYEQSRQLGIDRTKRIVAEQARLYPQARIHFTGMSEGADVAAHVIADIAAGDGPVRPERVGVSSLVGNPSRNLAAPRHGNAGNGGGLFPGQDYGQLTPQVLEVCDAGDVVCDTDDVAPRMYDDAVTSLVTKNAPLVGRFAPTALSDLAGAWSLGSLAGRVADLPASVAGWVVHIASYVPSGGFAAATDWIMSKVGRLS
ncbi:cutinase family protein [Corynebacterium bovis]|uniref:cutinase family protein n=1 Tax=Corynebacterium bovis TaxID=36808 RepID=UPI00163B5DAE|nr:cutinase family protein [Corynebacterium bovis]